MGLIGAIIIGALAGWLAGNFMKGAGFGLVGNIIVGILGGTVGSYAFGILGISMGSQLIGSLVTATVGAVILLFLIGLVKK